MRLFWTSHLLPVPLLPTLDHCLPVYPKCYVLFHLCFFFLSHNFILFLGVLSYGLALAPWLGTLRAGRILHRELLVNIMRLPLRFFDTTPVGRIMSRFSKDIESLDTTLPELFDAYIWCIFEVNFQF